MIKIPEGSCTSASGAGSRLGALCRLVAARCRDCSKNADKLRVTALARVQQHVMQWCASKRVYNQSEDGVHAVLCVCVTMTVTPDDTSDPADLVIVVVFSSS